MTWAVVCNRKGEEKEEKKGLDRETQHFSLEIAVELVAALKETAISVPSVAMLSFLLTVWWTLGAF